VAGLVTTKGRSLSGESITVYTVNPVVVKWAIPATNCGKNNPLTTISFYEKLIAMPEILSENLQTLVSREDRQRVEKMANQEGRSLSQMIRILLLDSLAVWEKSAPGRRRKNC
jgi:hypothetical protein